MSHRFGVWHKFGAQHVQRYVDEVAFRWSNRVRKKVASKKGKARKITLTLGADKAYDVAQFVKDLQARLVTPHVAIDGHVRNNGKPRKTALDGRVTRHPGYEVSQRCRKRIEEVFGWIKSQAGPAKVKFRGRARVDAAFILTLAAYNLIRLPKLLAAAA